MGGKAGMGSGEGRGVKGEDSGRGDKRLERQMDGGELRGREGKTGRGGRDGRE